MIITCRACIAACIICTVVMLFSFYAMFFTPQGMAMMGMSYGDSSAMADMDHGNKPIVESTIGNYCEPGNFSCKAETPVDTMEGMDHSAMPTMDHASMTMGEMSAMLEGKSGQELDCAFLDGMIPHHEGALDMSVFLATSNRNELKDFAQAIITGQSREIAQMKAWQVEWGCMKK